MTSKNPERLTATEIRRRYLAFFAARDHKVVPSASLIPENDPTVLFNTAGMQPLVPYLMGMTHPSGSRLVDSQKCLRTDDIDEVGDNRHQTYFEMLGNWSLGDYFKKESIAWSWEFLTSRDEGLGLDPARLYITVFQGDHAAPKDEESVQLWQSHFQSVGIEAKVDCPLAEGGRIFCLNATSNWWGPAGQTGPCGPDTEMHYDIGAERAGAEARLTLESGLPDFDGGRLIEIWNNVFMQFNKDAEGQFTPLKQQNVDTGMGLERVAAIVGGVDTAYETDLFLPILQVIKPLRLSIRSERIVADHLRAAVMLLADGVEVSNKDRGYILRRLIRRAILHSLTDDVLWLEKLVGAVKDVYAGVYPEVEARSAEITEALKKEALKFLATLEKGKQEIAKLKQLTGKDAFDLYQSYGFPLELSKEYALERGISFSEAEFEAEFRRHQELSRTASAGQFASGLADHSEATVRYHTATHLLHAALRKILGEKVEQRGSNINGERLRFDFSHPEKVEESVLREVEQLVNGWITKQLPVSVETMSPEAALEDGAMGLFGHKYGDSITVYTVGEGVDQVSKEICTGPHVKNLQELGKFKIVKEESVSAGVRRIKAVLE